MPEDSVTDLVISIIGSLILVGTCAWMLFIRDREAARLFKLKSFIILQRKMVTQN